MKILLIGSGGREHALAWKLAASPKCKQLYCAPGNAGISEIAKCIDIQAEDIDNLVAFAEKEQIDFVVVGPEQPLCAGLVDPLIERNIKVFGPKENAAILEGSKSFTKDLCSKYDIPTAAYGRFQDIDEAIKFIQKQTPPIVIKADGLAAGKGVIIAENFEEAENAAREMLSGNSFGEAGQEIVIEEFMDGEELSYFALADGQTVLPLTSAQDHKRAYDGDKGPNTGGMGAYSPAHLITPELEQKILNQIIKPTIEGMKKENRPFTGILYAGLMIVDGQPKLIEYNVRFGDPECQPMMMRLKTDLVDLLYAAASGNLNDIQNSLEWADQSALSVVMATEGYPNAYPKGTPIKDIEEASAQEGVFVFHAGTAHNEKGELVNNGGRVLNITALADDIASAQNRAYQAIEKINWPSGFYRHDIGFRAVNALENKAA